MKTFEYFQSLSPSNDYYTLHDKLYLHILKRGEKYFEKAEALRNAITTPEELCAWQKNAREAFLDCIGEIPYDKNLPLNARVTGECIEDGLKIENVIFEARPHVHVTANLYLPLDTTSPVPAVLMQSGHASNGRLYTNYQRAARTIAEAGVAVFTIDPFGQGERHFYKDDYGFPEPTDDHEYVGMQCFLNGENLAKYFISDAMRAIDYLETRADIDSSKIGATGCSGGGTMTAVISLVDKRITASAPSCFLTTRKDITFAGSNQDAEQLWPGATALLFDHYELVAATCPNAYLLLAAKYDFFCPEGTQKLYKKCRELWKIAGVEDKMRIVWADTGHEYSELHAKAAAEFFCEIFLGKKIEAEVIQGNKNYAHLLATRSGEVVREFDDTLPLWKENLDKHEDNKKKIKDASKILHDKVFANRDVVPPNTRHFGGVVNANGILVERLMYFTQENLPCYGILFSPEDSIGKKLPITVCVWADGTNRLVSKSAFIRSRVEKGERVFVADVSTIGKTAPYRFINQSFGGYWTEITKLSHELLWLGDSLSALICHDIAKTFDMLKGEYDCGEITLYTEGNYSVFSDVLSGAGVEFKAEKENSIKAYDLISRKGYCADDINRILMPELALLID